MEQRKPTNLPASYRITLQLLGAAVLLLFLVIVFTPVYIHPWVSRHRISLMWCETGLLAMMVIEAVFAIQWLNRSLAAIVSEETSTASEDRYKFYDEKGDLKLIVQPDKLYYLEAADNYVIIHYMNAGKMEKMMIRNTLKNIEWRFREKGLIRCHRSYIVNVNNVQLLRRQEGEVLLDFGNDRLPAIPVSKGYGDKVLTRFSA